MNLAPIERRLRELEDLGKLEKLLHQRNETLPWCDVFAVLHYVACVGVAIHVVRVVLHVMETKGSLSDDDYLWFVVLALVAIGLRVASFVARPKAERLAKRVREQGRCLPAAIVQANPLFYAGGNTEWQPADLLVSFDENAASDPERLVGVARRLESLRHEDRRALPRDHAEIAWHLYHEMGPLPSMPVPAALTGGLRDCLLVSAMLPPQPLVVDDCVVCLVIANEVSPCAVAVVPADAVR